VLRFLFYICFARGRTGWLLVSLLYIHDSSSLYVTTIARQGIMAMNPLSYTEHKLKATKIITVNNTPDQRISSKTPFEHTPRVTIPPGKMPVSMCRFALHIAQKHLAAGFCPELLGGAYSAPQTP